MAPHWGGFYERLNRLVKSALRKTLRKSRLSYEEVETILIEIEGVLNSRPLTYVDDSDITEPLTPSHLMYGRNLLARTASVQPSKSNETPSNRIKHVDNLMKHFWKRFSTEYLSSLRERDRVEQRKHPRSTIVRVGDIVLIHQKQTARNSWPLGKVTRLITSDGQIRGAELHTATGKLNRPLNLLHPLDQTCLVQKFQLMKTNRLELTHGGGRHRHQTRCYEKFGPDIFLASWFRILIHEVSVSHD